MKKIAPVCVLALLLSPGQVLPADQKRSYSLEEVVVTARKRSESQQDVPVAVTAISGEQMKQNNISTIADVAKITPGLDQREGRKQGAFSIRGVGQIRLNEVQADPGVAVYLDGIFLARNDSQLLDIVAVESVQVLRGPQGTLFGKNSVGGAILVTTKDPYEEFTVSTDVLMDSLGQRNAQIAIDMPLIEDKLYSKFTVGSVQSDGYAEDDDTGRELGNDDRLVAALQVLWNINDNMSLKTLAYFNDQDENVPPYYCEQVTLTGALSFARAPGRPQAYHEACSEAEKLIGSEKVSHENTSAEYTSRDVLFGATFDWDMPNGTFKSITSYVVKGDSYADFDFDATDLLTIRSTSYVRERLAAQGVYDEDGGRYTLGQEFQYSGIALEDRLTYTVGVFGSWESLDKLLSGQSSTKEGWIGFESLPGLPSPNALCVFSGITGEDCLYVRGVFDASVTSYDNTSYALFSQFTYDLIPTLHLTGGLRYTYEHREIKLEQMMAQTVPPIAGIPLPPAIPVTVMTETQFNMLENDFIEVSRGELQYSETTFERLSPMVSLSWDISDHYEMTSVDGLMGYISVSEGFKSGGFNVLAAGIDDFEPEYVIATELGFKLDALNRKLRLNMAVYNSDYKDVQTIVAKIPSLGAPELSTQNAGLARMQGIEFEMNWLLGQSLVLVASGNYIDAEILEYDDEVIDPVTGSPRPVDRSDEPFPFIPEYVYALSARYSLFTDIGDFDFMLSRNSRAGQFTGGDAVAGLPEFQDAATIDGVDTWSTRITWTPWEDQRMRLALFGNNITDEEYVATGTAVYSGFGTNSITLGKKRHFGLELNYEFR